MVVLSGSSADRNIRSSVSCVRFVAKRCTRSCGVCTQRRIRFELLCTAAYPLFVFVYTEAYPFVVFSHSGLSALFRFAYHSGLSASLCCLHSGLSAFGFCIAVDPLRFVLFSTTVYPLCLVNFAQRFIRFILFRVAP